MQYYRCRIRVRGAPWFGKRTSRDHFKGQSQHVSRRDATRSCRSRANSVGAQVILVNSLTIVRWIVCNVTYWSVFVHSALRSIWQVTTYEAFFSMVDGTYPVCLRSFLTFHHILESSRTCKYMSPKRAVHQVMMDQCNVLLNNWLTAVLIILGNVANELSNLQL